MAPISYRVLVAITGDFVALLWAHVSSYKVGGSKRSGAFESIRRDHQL